MFQTIGGGTHFPICMHHRLAVLSVAKLALLFQSPGVASKVFQRQAPIRHQSSSLSLAAAAVASARCVWIFYISSPMRSSVVGSTRDGLVDISAPSTSMKRSGVFQP